MSHFHGGQKAGTGLLIAPGVVLTAAHVVVHDGSINKVRLRWKSDDPEFNETSGDQSNGFHDAVEQEVGDRGVIWSCQDLDLALVACTSPPNVPAISLSSEPVTNGMYCWAEAFPRIAEDSLEQSIWLKGNISDPDGSAEKSRCQFAASIDRRDPVDADEAEWSGASGASLVAEKNGRVVVYGVIVQENISFTSQLTVVPMSEALRGRGQGSLYSAWKSLLASNSEDWPDHDPDPATERGWIDRHCKRISAALERVSETAWAEILALEPSIGNHPKSAGDFEAATEQMTKLEPKTAQGVLSKVVNSLSNRGWYSDADRVRELLFELVPLHIDQDGRCFIAWMRQGDGKVSLSAVAGSPTKAEVLAAGLDGMAADFLDRKRGGHDPVGAARIPYPPREGLDHDGTAYIEQIGSFLEKEDNPLGLAQDVAGFVATEEYGPGASPNKRMARHLQRRRDLEGKRSYYLTVPASRMLNDYQRDRLLQALNSLMDLAPQIRVLALDIDPDILDNDDVEFGNINSAVPLAVQTAEGETNET